MGSRTARDAHLLGRRQGGGDSTRRARRRRPLRQRRGLRIAIADWLDAAAADEWAHGPHCLTPCEDCDDDPRAAHVRRALAVATVVLAASGTESLRSETP
ncbi:hypothetical protein BN13_280012 [Nostocoides jenkinsii Ben 74]|uniref:Uncharacterized protein n=1 Tax=Nostocoides jenkinsii Ben 74 TaxID=1193518 RepID=A0A077MAY6_9MICO|nr:hypothetical protein BN13_280012 [Tetrasphaera jenkinsii Ben 74]